ncbi:MAG TPA: hypothetical protein VGI18_08705 [Burkholderiales bacterium]|jgi:hypothetical protein
MSAPAHPGQGPAPVKNAARADPLSELAEKIFIQLAANVYGNLAGGDVKKPDPKALGAYAYKIAEGFDQASRETVNARAAIEAENKSKVRLDEVDLSAVFAAKK